MGVVNKWIHNEYLHFHSFQWLQRSKPGVDSLKQNPSQARVAEPALHPAQLTSTEPEALLVVSWHCEPQNDWFITN